MSGHSKWSTIKRKKGVADSKRSKVFTKLIKEITVATRMGGGDMTGNARLRLAIDKAKAASLPRDNIERAVKKGSGTDAADHYEEVTYEGYGPAGVAMIVDCLTDNKVRTVAEIRMIFSKRGGNMGESGSVAWMFEKKGTLSIAANSLSEDELIEKALDAGAEDVVKEEENFMVTTAFVDFLKVKDALEKQSLPITEAQVVMNPKTSVPVKNAEEAQKILNLIEALEDNDDVQNVWANFDIDDAIMEKLG